jgi:hypothetical protein
MELGIFVPIFLKLLWQLFFHDTINRPSWGQNGAFMQILSSHAIVWSELNKMLRTSKYNLQYTRKCQRNLSLLRLFLATVTCYLNCLDTAALAHPFWALETFQSVFLSLAVGQIEHLQRRLPPPLFTVVGFRLYHHTCRYCVTALQVPLCTSCLAL